MVSSQEAPLGVFSVIKQANISKSAVNVLKLATDVEGGSDRKKTI